ncbi:DUF6059 family protein [Streptomyces nitrosporeus]|uniref:DUF6059 family protein n=1 Tax=Streptomyces nitrosporeus TaxID=28894 RepID=UPI0039A3B051
MRRALYEIYLSLTAAGWVWMGHPAMGPPLHTVAPRPLTGPPDAHPERLRPDLPLTGTELALQAQLLTPSRRD